MEALAAELADLERRARLLGERDRCVATTDPWFEVLMNTHVSVQGRRTVECFAADSACVWLLRCMDDLMAAECRGLAKTLAADL